MAASSAAERARLLERLIASFEDDPGLKEAWEHEAIRRDLELENGEINPESGEQALARIRAGIR